MNTKCPCPFQASLRSPQQHPEMCRQMGHMTTVSTLLSAQETTVEWGYSVVWRFNHHPCSSQCIGTHYLKIPPSFSAFLHVSCFSSWFSIISYLIFFTHSNKIFIKHRICGKSSVHRDELATLPSSEEDSICAVRHAHKKIYYKYKMKKYYWP